MRISDWSSDVCSSDLPGPRRAGCRDRRQLLDGRPWSGLFAKAGPRSICCQLVEHARERYARDISRRGGGTGCNRLDSCPCRLRSADCGLRSEEHTSELQSLMRTSYAVFFLKKKTTH